MGVNMNYCPRCYPVLLQYSTNMCTTYVYPYMLVMRDISKVAY